MAPVRNSKLKTLMKVKPWPAAMMEQPVIMEKDEEVKTQVLFMSHEKSWYFVYFVPVGTRDHLSNRENLHPTSLPSNDPNVSPTA